MKKNHYHHQLTDKPDTLITHIMYIPTMDSKIGLYVKSYLIGIYVLQLALNRDDTCYATIVMYIYGKKHIMCTYFK